jgi:hypothetical protein
MRAYILALLLILFVGFAGAVTLDYTPTFSFGPELGFTNPGTIQASDLYATDDLKVDDDAAVAGDLVVTGTLQAGVTASDTGSIATDVTIAADKFLKCASGTGQFDWVLGSGIFRTTTGTNTLSGNVVISGTKTFTTGTGAVALNGDVTLAKTVTVSKATSVATTTTLTSADTKTLYEIDASGGNVSLVLPAASGVTGRVYMVGSTADPGSNYAFINSTSGKIGGGAGAAAATGIKTTDANFGMTLVSDGTNYLITGAYGTWAAA